MATWFRRRRTPEDRIPEDRTPAVHTTVDAARFRPDRAPQPHAAPRVAGGRPLDRPPLLVAGAGHNPAVFRYDGQLPFGMAVYPDTTTPREPWFGGWWPAPDRIVPGRQALDEAGES